MPVNFTAKSIGSFVFATSVLALKTMAHPLQGYYQHSYFEYSESEWSFDLRHAEYFVVVENCW